MEILTQLGANQTAFIQFALFIITVSFLTVFVYGPFFKAYDQRLKMTKGADQVATETQDEAKKLEQIYQVRAREINDKIKDLFEATRKQAAEAVAKILTEAKELVTTTTDRARSQIADEKLKASQTARTLSDEVAGEITKKLTGASL